MGFAQRLDELLTEQGISAYQISKATGISDRLIGYWRKGEKKPTLENIAKLSEYLGVSVDWLLNGADVSLMSNHIGKVTGDNVVVGMNRGTLISADGKKKQGVSPEGTELLKMFEGFTVPQRMEILSKAYAFAKENEEETK